jgi:Fe-S cluster biogenesis protein NfuA
VQVAVDSTVSTPVLTRPIEFGADLVVHSATKYLNGHSDVLAGAVVTARCGPFWERLRSWRRNAGAVLGPFEAWLLQRGMRTLFIRVRRSSETALALAHYFHGHPALKAVLYPGLPSHPGHKIAARQMDGGFGSMLSIRVVHGEVHAMNVAAAVQVFKRATSLGGVESLIEHRKSTEGPSSPVPDDLLRLSIGLEAPKDLIADLKAALDAATQIGTPSRASAVIEVPAISSSQPDVVAAVSAVIERSVAPSIIARGGEIRLVSVHNGLVILEASGSPGAILPVTASVEALLCTAVSEVTEVRVVWPGEGETQAPVSPPGAAGDLAARVQKMIDSEVNPAIAIHQGRVSLVDVTDGRVQIRLEGGCQGCNLAAVTIRQGIEPLLRERLADVAAVVDVTDHEAGTAPFYSPSKR